MSPTIGRIGLFLAATAAAVAFVAATPHPGIARAASDDGGGIAVTGTGSVTATPDIARLSLGISVTASTVAQARNDAAAAMQRVQDAIRQQGVAEKDIQTQYVNISPVYASTRDSQPRITGYMVSNQVQITVRNLDNASGVLDAAVAAGGDATRVNGISFAVEDPERILAQARTQAVKNARAHAETLATAAGVGVGKPKSIVESSSGGTFPPSPLPRAATAEAAPTPINPGEQRLSVTVSIVYELAP